MASESTVGSRKKGRQDSVNGAFALSKKSKPSTSEMDSFPPGIGTKSKPCTKFFSTAGCPFGEGCHFLHYVPGGPGAVSQMLQNMNNAPTRKQDTSSGPGVVKTRICNNYNTAEGCKFGDQCRFAHGERELGKPIASATSHQTGGGRRMSGMVDPGIPPPAATFGASATAKISVDASLAGAIIGKGGMHSKEICRATGAKLSIRDHESDPTIKNIEMEGTFDQINHASSLVRELISSVGAGGGAMKNPGAPHLSGRGPASNFKTKLCENYDKGACTFADRCHFAHGEAELRKL